MKKEKSCGVIVINKDKQILLVKHQAGHYGFPKGHVESGETEIETAIRETKEETNIDVSIIGEYRFVISYDTKYNTHKDVVYFIGYPTTHKIIPELVEVSDVKWVDYEQVASLLQFQNIIDMWNDLVLPIIDDIIDKIKENCYN